MQHGAHVRNQLTDVVIDSWRHTAEVLADPELAAAPSAPADSDYGSVPEPRVRRQVAPERGDHVAPPAGSGEWELRFATSEAAKGWEAL
jgi:hypothetical protein